MNNSPLLKRDLKNYSFDFSKDTRIFSIYDKVTGKVITMDKVRFLSLMRFGLRCFNSMTIKSRK